MVRLRPEQLIILEGIHGLNPRLLPGALALQSFKIYASALTQLNLDRHNRVSTTDTRLIRRIVRPHSHASGMIEVTSRVRYRIIGMACLERVVSTSSPSG